jgi:capsular exopolysaccharide synthesis family protein
MSNPALPSVERRTNLPAEAALYERPRESRLSRTSDLEQLVHKLRRYSILIGSVCAAVVLLALVVAKTATPVYTASTTILVGTPAGSGGGLSDIEKLVANSETVRTQAQVIMSRALAQRVVERLALDKVPEFNPWLRGPGFLGSLFGKEWKPADQQQVLDTAVSILLSKITATPADRSHVLLVEVESEDPQRAAQIANTVGKLYIEQLMIQRSQVAQQTNTWFNEQLKSLRTRVDAAERAVEEYRRANGLYETSNSTLTAAQLGELNSQMITAQSARAEARARLQQAEETLKGGGNVDSLPPVLNSPLIQSLQEKLADTERQQAEVSSTLGPKHPQRINMQAQIRDLKSRIHTEVGKVVEGLRAEAMTMDARYGSLRSSLNDAKGMAGSSNEKSVQLRQLEREAEASRSLFESFLLREKETSAEKSMQLADASIVSPAAVPRSPSFPPTTSMLVGSVIVGLLLGALAAVIVDSFDRTFRTTAEVIDVTGLPVLATMPKARKPDILGGKEGDADSPFSEAARKLHTRLAITSHSNAAPTYMFTSATPDEGKSGISVAMSRQAALQGRNVIVIDGDLRRPSVHSMMRQKSFPGLIELLRGEATPEEVVHRDPATGMNAIFAGRLERENAYVPDLHSMRALLASLGRHYDMVVLDAPPVLVGDEVLHYAQMVQNIVLVVQWGHTHKEVVVEALNQLAIAGGNVSGVALSKVNRRQYKQYASVDLHYDYSGRGASALSI